MKKILITGGAGYIGSILTPLMLSENYKVTVIDNLSFNQNSLNNCCYYKNFYFVNGDITNYKLMDDLISQSDIIIPLAAIVGAPACAKNENLAKIINYDALLNIADKLSNDQIVIYPNTNSGYGISISQDYCDESTPLNPISTYGKHKVEVEKAFLSNNNAITLRLATVFGVSPRMRTDLLVNDFVLRAFKDRYLILFEEHFRRNFIHVRDVANAFKFAINNFDKMKGESFNLGLTNANLTKRELAEKIKEFLPNTYLHSSEIGEDPDKRDYIVSNKKIENIGWRPEYSLDDGIQELIKCYSYLKTAYCTNI